MTVHVLLTDSTLVQRIGRTLAHTVWHGAAAAVLLRLTLAVVRRSARARYALACGAMAATVAAAVVTFVVVGQPIPRAARAVGTPALIPLPSSVPAAVPAVVAPPASSFDGHRATAWAVLLWATGVAIQAAWQAVGWTRIRRLGRSPAVADDRWAAAMATAADRVGVRRAVRLLASVRVDVPVVLGVLRPAVVVPVSLLTDLSPDHIAALLAHEFSHVRRHDVLVNLIQCGVEAVVFYHPAVWWMSAVVRREREHCCDDAAGDAVGGRPAVAAMLVALEERRGPRLAVAATGGSLAGRVRRLVAARPRQPRRSVGSAVCVAMAAAVVVAGLAWVGLPATGAQVVPTTRPAETEHELGYAYVGGDMARPGVYNLWSVRSATVRQVLTAAGLPAGKGLWVSVGRHDGDRVTRVVDGVPFASMVAGTPADLQLRPGDEVRVTTADPGRATLGRVTRPAIPGGGTVYIGGDVDRVGVYSLTNTPSGGRMTASQAVMSAGDVKVEHSRQAWVTIRRRSGPRAEVTIADLPFASLLDGTTIDPALEPNDNVMVSTIDPAGPPPAATPLIPATPPPEFIILGAVKRPGGYELGYPLTVSQAVRCAGGTADGVNHPVTIIRDKKPIELGSIDALGGDPKTDPYLHPGDLLLVSRKGHPQP